MSRPKYELHKSTCQALQPLSKCTCNGEKLFKRLVVQAFAAAKQADDLLSESLANTVCDAIGRDRIFLATDPTERPFGGTDEEDFAVLERGEPVEVAAPPPPRKAKKEASTTTTSAPQQPRQET